MTLNNLIEKLTAGGQFKILNKGTDVEREVTGTYCCDLLSIAMSLGDGDGKYQHSGRGRPDRCRLHYSGGGCHP
jgi:hypothetical protein